MAHLAARASAALPVEEQTCPGYTQRRREVGCAVALPQVSEQIHDRGGTRRLSDAEGQVAHRTHELLELARGAGQLGGVIRVVWTRRELVHEQSSVAREEHLHGEDPLEREAYGDRTRELARLRGDGRIQITGEHAPRED